MVSFSIVKADPRDKNVVEQNKIKNRIITSSVAKSKGRRRMQGMPKCKMQALK